MWTGRSPQILIDFPGVDLLQVALPLQSLGLDELFEDVGADGLSHQAVLDQLVERIVQIGREFVYSKTPLLALAHAVDVLAY